MCTASGLAKPALWAVHPQTDMRLAVKVVRGKEDAVVNDLPCLAEIQFGFAAWPGAERLCRMTSSTAVGGFFAGCDSRE